MDSGTMTLASESDMDLSASYRKGRQFRQDYRPSMPTSTPTPAIGSPATRPTAPVHVLRIPRAPNHAPRRPVAVMRPEGRFRHLAVRTREDAGTSPETFGPRHVLDGARVDRALDGTDVQCDEHPRHSVSEEDNVLRTKPRTRMLRAPVDSVNATRCSHGICISDARF
jgi:hypothetical protein